MDTRIDFLYLSEQDMLKAGVAEMGVCVETMEEMFKCLGEGDYIMGGANGNSHGIPLNFPDDPQFPGMPKNGPDRRFMAMPAYLGGSFQICGMKWYGSNIENRAKGLPRSILTVMLNDKDTGAPIALMSANLLSAYRTGAVPGVAAKYLAREDAKVVGIVGPGVMGKTTLESYLSVRPGIDTVQVCGRGHAAIDSCVKFTKEKFPKITTIKVVKSMEEAVRGADIVSVATSSPLGIDQYPFIDEKWIKPGALFTLPGSIRFDDDFLLKRATCVTDNWKLYEAWGEELPQPGYACIPLLGVHLVDMLREGKIDRGFVKDFGEIIAGKIPGRKSADEIILLSVGGMPVEDLAWGLTLYHRARKLNIGTKLNLWDKPFLA
jgi:ornithine cyclodeaminase